LPKKSVLDKPLITKRFSLTMSSRDQGELELPENSLPMFYEEKRVLEAWRIQLSYCPAAV
jgi:hypothetical protein